MWVQALKESGTLDYFLKFCKEQEERCVNEAVAASDVNIGKVQKAFGERAAFEKLRQTVEQKARSSEALTDYRKRVGYGNI
jgi:hypothetical protein